MPKTDISDMMLLGAEGHSEVANFHWIREAASEEHTDFCTAHPNLKLTDEVGRPYWVMVLEKDAPEWAQEIVYLKLRSVHFEK